MDYRRLWLYSLRLGAVHRSGRDDHSVRTTMVRTRILDELFDLAIRRRAVCLAACPDRMMPPSFCLGACRSVVDRRKSKKPSGREIVPLGIHDGAKRHAYAPGQQGY